MTNRRLDRFVCGVGWVACLASIALALVFPGVARAASVQWSPWLLGLLLLGIPHGAFDHKVGVELRRLGGDSPPPRAKVGPGFYAAYLAAAAAVMATWFVSPGVASVSFLVLAAAHFGQGDVYWSRQFGLAGRSTSVGYRGALLLTRSLIPIALPLLAFPLEFAGAGDELASRLFGRRSWSVPSAGINTGLAVLAVIIGVQLVWAAWLGWTGDGPSCRSAAGDIAETMLLVAMFTIVPPVLALGVYFNAWHSLRHVARLLTIGGSTRDLVASGHLLPAFVTFERQAIPMTGAALAMMIGLGLVVGRSLMSVVDLGLVALVGLSALTLPHVLIVAWMDARQGVWSARPDPG